MSTSKKSKKSKKHVRCIVRNCQNHTDEGQFVGPMCGPCYHFVAEGIDRACTSQAFRNALEFVWPRIKSHLGRQAKTFFLEFEANPHQLADRLLGASLADRELANLVEGSLFDRAFTDMIRPCQKTEESRTERTASRGSASTLGRAGSRPARKTSR